jgi:hypothetical protein
MGTPGEHSAATYAQAPAAERAKLLGTPNVIMAGLGIPNDDAQADKWTAEVSHCPRLVWEIMADGKGGPPFVYEKRIAQVRRLVEKHPRIEAVLLDDMSSVGIDKGFKPEHIRAIRTLLAEKHTPAKIWGVLYSMNFGRKDIKKYIDELDLITLAVWHAKELGDLEKHIAHCEATFPGKPIMLALYLYDYGEGRKMPKDLMELQCETARRLIHAGRIQGVVYVSIDNDADAVNWVADWIKRVGDEPVGKQARSSRVPAKTVAMSQQADSPTLDLTLADPAKWHFLGGKGPWIETDGVIQPPNEGNLHSRAFYTPASFSDLVAEFEFNANYRETGTGAAGIILRAADANHFYVVWLPWGGQQLRANHFWAHVMKVDGDGYLRSLKAAWVPGVPSETDRWYRVRVEAKGPTITVLVDGREALSVTDDSFKGGAVGLAGYGWYSFRNVKIHGPSTPLAAWDRSATIPVHHFTVGLDSQQMPSGCVAPNGDVLLAAGSRLVRSKDKGRTWSEPETLPAKLGSVNDYGNTMFRTAKGRLIVQIWRSREETKKDVPGIEIAESTDNGTTWSDPVASEVAPGWPEIPAKLVPYGPLLETPDGGLLRFLLGGAKEETKFTNVVTWSAVHCKAYVVRSADGGKTWSAAIEIDRPSWSGQARGTIPGSLDLTEPTGVVLGDKVTVLVRPIYSPYMWQCWSNDRGATWDAAARATFPGYAQSMTRTTSGTIVCAHRFPQYSVNTSRDGGLHWDAGTVIDYPVWAMGCLVEVEPDVLLCTYMNYSREAPLLAQRLRVTGERIEPAK